MQQKIVPRLELEEGICLKWVKTLYLQYSCVSNIDVSINHSQLNSNSKSWESGDSIVYVLLEIFVWASHESKNYKFYKNSKKGVLWGVIEN